MYKKIIFDEEARKKLEIGIDSVAKVVGLTLGPRGRNVVLEKGFGAPQIVNDGVTIAKEVELKDKFENLGAQLLKEVAIKTNDVVGDGSSSSTVLARAMIKEGIKNIAAGANGILIKQGIELASAEVIKNLKNMAKPINGYDDIKNVATISSGSEKMGTLIADAMKTVGKDGIITTGESKTDECTLDFIDGYQFDKGYISPYFVTKTDTMLVEYEGVNILFVDGVVDSFKSIVPFLESVYDSGEALVIIAEDFNDEVIVGSIQNKMSGVCKIALIKAPSYGERRSAILEDMAILTGGTVINKQLGITLENADNRVLGHAKKIKVSKDTTTIFEGDCDSQEVDLRVKQLKAEMDSCTTEYDRERINERYAKLVGGICVIRIGAPTEVEQKELQLRFEDALNATKAAVEEGIVAGGGKALVNCISVLDKSWPSDTDTDIITGYNIVKKSLSEPMSIIVENAGQKPDIIIEKVMPGDMDLGYDALTGKYGNLLEMGIIDPVKVTRTAIESATSISAMVLTTDALVISVDENKTDNNNSGCSSMGCGC